MSQGRNQLVILISSMLLNDANDADSGRTRSRWEISKDQPGLPSSSRRMSEVAMRGKRPRRHAGESQVRDEVAARGRPDASSAGIRRGLAAKLFKINAPPAPGISTLPGRPTESKFPRVCNQGTSATSSSLEPVASSSFGVLGQEFSAPRQPSDMCVWAQL